MTFGILLLHIWVRDGTRDRKPCDYRYLSIFGTAYLDKCNLVSTMQDGVDSTVMVGVGLASFMSEQIMGTNFFAPGRLREEKRELVVSTRS